MPKIETKVVGDVGETRTNKSRGTEIFHRKTNKLNASVIKASCVTLSKHKTLLRIHASSAVMKIANGSLVPLHRSPPHCIHRSIG